MLDVPENSKKHGLVVANEASRESAGVASGLVALRDGALCSGACGDALCSLFTSMMVRKSRTVETTFDLAIV